MQMQFDLVFRSMPGDRPAAEFAEMQALMETFFRTWLVPLSGGWLLNVLFNLLFFLLKRRCQVSAGAHAGRAGPIRALMARTAAYEAPLTIAGRADLSHPLCRHGGARPLALSAGVGLLCSQSRAAPVCQGGRVAVVLLPIAIVLFVFSVPLCHCVDRDRRQRLSAGGLVCFLGHP